MSNELAAALQEIERYAGEQSAGHDPAHDILHVQRVVRNAREIVRNEPAADAFVVEAACWLHDIVQIPKGTGAPGEAARRSAQAANDVLRRLNLNDDLMGSITHAVEAHSFSGGLRAQTIEAAIVQDADRLDALGAVGLARLWVMAGVLGSDLYHPGDPSGSSRDLNDRQFGLDHIGAKLLVLPDLMNTSAGRELAQRRAEFVRSYRETLLAEISGKC